jgi:hypothetical protein
MSQAAVILPGSPLTLGAAAAVINGAWAAQVSKFSGSAAPTLGPGASSALVAGQDWLNTTVSQYVWNIYDGANFCPLLSLDTVAHAVTVPGPWRNILSDNGGFEVWQRGAGSSASIAVAASTTKYTADRWYVTTGANQASTIAAVAGLTNNSNLAAKVQRNNANTGTTAYTFGFPLDTDEVVRLRGNKVTISAVVKAGANWSPASGTITATLYVGTGAVAKRGGGFTGETNVVAATANPAVSTPAPMSATSAATVPTNATQGELQFTWTPVGTAGADDSITIDDVQLEVGIFASMFERVPIEKMLLECKRHFWKSFRYGTAPAAPSGANTGEIQVIAGNAGTAAELVVARHPVSMRGTPTITTYNTNNTNAQVRDQTASADCSAVATANVTTESVSLTATGNFSTVVGNTLGVHLIADAGI